LGRDGQALIAEVKRSSPSAGRILEDFDPPRIASEFEKGGAAAVSVLTEECFFEGHIYFMEEVKKAISLPVLRKDFIIDSYQVHETRAHGGDALLLIVRILEDDRLGEFMELARSLDLATLVEVHTREELETALTAGAEIIGINNRNLRTFETDLTISEVLAPLVPDGKIVVSESGIRSGSDIARLRKAGISAFLVGEHLSRSTDAREAIRGLLCAEARQ
ncbi:MAG: indole-3-glycerol phosphate synthase TrpC, partial [Syntrophales bacterium]|nr:indole-3-glycerol phosphate synthase TrpC [Syntrophales bacterium]